MRLLWRRQPIDALLTDPATPPALRRRLELVGRVRSYAHALGLEVGEQYTSYVAWPGDRIVTTVVATRPGEIDAAGFRFPVIGRVPYKGFFAVEAAEREADALREQGLDVCTSPVAAYSTLGWLDDPLTEPMLRADDIDLVETLLHELVHATAYVADDADFNESVATFIGAEAAARFLAEHGIEGDPRAPHALAWDLRARNEDARRIADALHALREDVRALYAETDEGAERLARRRALADAARTSLSTLPLRTRDAAALAERVDLGDACLALRATYSDDLARHAAVLEALDGDLHTLVARLREARTADVPRETFFAIAERPVASAIEHAAEPAREGGATPQGEAALEGEAAPEVEAAPDGAPPRRR